MDCAAAWKAFGAQKISAGFVYSPGPALAWGVCMTSIFGWVILRHVKQAVPIAMGLRHQHASVKSGPFVLQVCWGKKPVPLVSFVLSEGRGGGPDEDELTRCGITLGIRQRPSAVGG